MGTKYGFVYRLLTNHDASFYSLLYSAQSNTSPEAQNCPIKLKIITEPTDLGLHYGGAISMLMAKTKIEDNVMDQFDLKSRIIRAFLNKKMPLVYKELQQMGLNLNYIDSQIRLQQDLEDENSSLDMLATPTMNVVAEIISHTARLAEKEKNIPYLYGLGSAVGRLMYVLDCVNDLPQDVSEGKFNPLINASKRKYDNFRGQVARIVKHSLSSIRRNSEKLDINKHGTLIRETLGSTLFQAAEIILNPAPIGGTYPLSFTSFGFGSILEDSAPRFPNNTRCWSDCTCYCELLDCCCSCGGS